MKKGIFILLAILLVAGGLYWYKRSNIGINSQRKQEPIALKKHSTTFNTAVATALKSYFGLSAALVNADTAKAKESTREFIKLMDSIPMVELQKDTTGIYDIAMSSFSNIKSNALSLLTQTDITELRKDFSMVSENLYPFFKVINYEGEKMYWQNCPMAFGDDKGANWISETVEIVNPYLGKNHPEFKATMLHCGSIKDTIKPNP